MKYVYPVIITPEGQDFNVAVPDLPGCFTFGTSLVEAIEMARDAIAMWLCDAEDKGEVIPAPRNPQDMQVPQGSIVSLVDVDTDEYRLENDNRSVKKTLSIPNWLNAKAQKAGINFSQTLQKALKQELGLK
ncbi:MAG: type II toxin-antitoxin system HicB family antitoxin [Syntrophothermus sp.]|uniref:type II toxin-antitoxin system HicB family antitoxin n=1 Tax=Syntrophothermus sp. TaxID=2736299 RepID=UPI00257FE111|nr:type II toxin-antitoxin system HicB family antitoxin [Syntrophothermus sp.]NSW82954.1 type II toxin-antitoxin system HicB family antitoxin [Syntrophothermus sp.]